MPPIAPSHQPEGRQGGRTQRGPADQCRAGRHQPTNCKRPGGTERGNIPESSTRPGAAPADGPSPHGAAE